MWIRRPFVIQTWQCFFLFQIEYDDRAKVTPIKATPIKAAPTKPADDDELDVDIDAI